MPEQERERGRKPASGRQLIAGVLLAVLGFAAVVQVQDTQRDDQYEGMREEDLVQLLNSLTSATQRAENEIAELEETRASLRDDTESRRAAVAQARERATVLGLLAGTLPAVGPGVVVTVRDPEGNVGIDHLLNGLQELRDSGAEAVEINDAVRVIAQTSFEDSPDGIVVDGTTLSPPYKLEVIGDPPTLTRALKIYQGFVYDVEHPTVGGQVDIAESSEVEIATLVEPPDPEFAQPVENE